MGALLRSSPPPKPEQEPGPSNGVPGVTPELQPIKDGTPEIQEVEQVENVEQVNEVKEEVKEVKEEVKEDVPELPGPPVPAMTERLPPALSPGDVMAAALIQSFIDEIRKTNLAQHQISQQQIERQVDILRKLDTNAAEIGRLKNANKKLKTKIYVLQGSDKRDAIFSVDSSGDSEGILSHHLSHHISHILHHT